MSFSIDNLQSDLLSILMDHDDLVEQARDGFGHLMRTAAYPKGLMPLAEAQRIVAGFDASTKKLTSFLTGLYGVRDVPPEVAAEFEAMRTKASKSLDKFKDDQKKAQEALAKYEDALVGEHFQEAFEAVRQALLDFDIADGIDVDFKTEMFLDKDPAYATGGVFFTKGTLRLMQVVVGYKAADDSYWGNVYSEKKYKTYSIVKKEGHTKLPAFVRELTEQAKALSDTEGTGIFTSRKKVEWSAPDPDAIQRALLPELEAQIRKQWGSTVAKIPYSRPLEIAQDGTKGTAQVSWVGWGWTQEMESPTVAAGHFKYYEGRKTELSKPFTLEGWDVTAGPGIWQYKVQVLAAEGFYKELIFSTVEEMQKNWPVEWQDKPDLVALQARAALYKVPVDPKSKNVKALQNAIRLKSKPPKEFKIFNGTMNYTLTQKKSASKSASRVAALYRHAGSTTFVVYQEGKDAKQAYRDAVDAAQHEHGHGSYSGTIGTTNGFSVRRSEVFTSKTEVDAFIDKDIEKASKWEPAFAVPFSKERILVKDTVTVKVEARDEVEARKKGILRIKATGRIPPKARIIVEVPEGTMGLVLDSKGARVSTWKVTGLRKQSLVGDVTGWYFYGWAAE